MTSTYTSFPLDAIVEVLSPEKGWVHANSSNADDLGNTEEHVFDWHIKGTPYKVRVFTSVQISTGWTRDCGKDAIRVCVPKRLKSKRVYRTEGWQDRLRTRILAVIDEIRQAPQSKSDAPTKPKLVLANLPKLLKQAEGKLKYPKIRFTAEGLKLQLHVAGAKSKYHGDLMVTDGGSYGDNTFYGRVDQFGVFHRTSKCDDRTALFLAALNEDPAQIAADYGKQSGRCCFCNLELTHGDSLAVGYGPVCASHYNLPWGVKETK